MLMVKRGGHFCKQFVCDIHCITVLHLFYTVLHLGPHKNQIQVFLPSFLTHFSLVLHFTFDWQCKSNHWFLYEMQN